MAEPLISRNYAIFLAMLATLVLAVPFVDRKDWIGWVASFVVIAIAITILGIWLNGAAQRIVDLWRDDLD